MRFLSQNHHSSLRQNAPLSALNLQAYARSHNRQHDTCVSVTILSPLLRHFVCSATPEDYARGLELKMPHRPRHQGLIIRPRISFPKRILFATKKQTTPLHPRGSTLLLVPAFFAPISTPTRSCGATLHLRISNAPTAAIRERRACLCDTGLGLPRLTAHHLPG